MSSHQTTEAKKEEYRKYLEKSGVIDQLTRVLVGLYQEPERPPNATDFIKKYMGAPSDTDVDHLKAQNQQLTLKVKELEQHIEELKNELEKERAEK